MYLESTENNDKFLYLSVKILYKLLKTMSFHHKINALWLLNILNIICMFLYGPENMLLITKSYPIINLSHLFLPLRLNNFFFQN